jgi:hypothetical protein
MSVRYIYNTGGEYKAFITNDNLFDPNCEWIGFVLSGYEVYDSKTLNFLGYILDDDRIAFKRNDIKKLIPLRPLRPLKPLRPLRPLRRFRMPRLLYPYLDIFE